VDGDKTPRQICTGGKKSARHPKNLDLFLLSWHRQLGDTDLRKWIRTERMTVNKAHGNALASFVMTIPPPGEMLSRPAQHDLASILAALTCSGISPSSPRAMVNHPLGFPKLPPPPLQSTSSSKHCALSAYPSCAPSMLSPSRAVWASLRPSCPSIAGTFPSCSPPSLSL